MFFDIWMFEPLLDNAGFKYAVDLFDRFVRSSNCRDQLDPESEYYTGKCDRRTAFPTGKCAGVLSMPGTMTGLLLPDGKYAIQPRTEFNSTLNETVTVWEPPLTDGKVYGQRFRFPGSALVFNEATGDLETCTAQLCPKGTLSRDGTELINYAPFFAEGGESYAVRGGAPQLKKNIMAQFFGWFSSLPVTVLPLSGQYRRSHLDEAQREVLSDGGWPAEMIDDLFDVLNFYFADDETEGGNPVQDLLIIGFSEYMARLANRLFDEFILHPDSLYAPVRNPDLFDDRFDAFVAALTEDYEEVTDKYGKLEQLARWRASLDLQLIAPQTLCENPALVTDAACTPYLPTICLQPNFVD
jgi:hypothetical protein